MTTAQFIQDGNRFFVSITGHADYGPPGADIVCSACSVLACTLVNIMANMDEDEIFSEFDSNIEGGDVRMKFTVKNDDDLSVVEDVIYTISTGFMLLEHQYPDNVRHLTRFSPEIGENCQNM